ncbi:NAD-binding Rossmann fold oxidoreductase family protein [Talaromyces proteolyticus]|uniref:NAD-binding Rossmann fold oxidoreductase family protein n=1 Tax=Talaromyces proteolyticus TaxID=1131652 RepID=A0AAD4KKS1_9EURO|nr:NAD-binding Rossmann fold oxidoreductase family protein [Talaromyces proteolyticus]KAH8693253.1 NAD-binding Rossmann fold oxidoreductase family protein [Talaromyces proteolyticus]
MSSGDRRIKFALFGLGRLGVLRARILAFQQPRIELVAVCDTKPGTDKWAAENLPLSVKYFSEPQECLKNSGAEAVLICTATATHAPLILQALDLGLHVMCEKPVSVDIATTKAVVEKSASRPDLKFLVPFTRRYDKSYRQAKALIDNGDLGEIHAVETTGIDQADPNAFFVSFSEQSGGIFLDFGIHTVSPSRRRSIPIRCKSGLSNPKKQVNRVIAFGQLAVYGDLAKYGDADNAWGLVEFANGKIFKTYLGRTLTSGFEDTTRLCGTKGHSIISANSNVEIRDHFGIRTQSVPDAFTLFDATFLADLAEFADAVLDNKPLTCQPEDAFEAGKICAALQYSFRKGVPVYFDDNGLPIME